ncbi:MAG: AI-2E family transporter [Verrucomicrobia bacterium]|nr:AI-2E family transporter [Verrucomicrobiota bacterium]
MPEAVEFKTPSELRKLIHLAYFLLVLGTLAWAKDFLLPVAFAGLLSLLLTPTVSWLESRGFKRVVAVLSVVAIAFIIIGVLCAVVSTQALDLINSVPKYRSNIVARWESLQHGPPGPFSVAMQNVSDLVNELGKVSASAADAQQQGQPTKVQIVGSGEGLLALARNSLTPLVGPVTEGVIVVLLVVFMLLERQRIRRRFLRLVGHSHTAMTTLAVDEAGTRLSGFLRAQLQVNSVFALAVGIGLYFLGIPNAVLWAVLTMALRFLPYVGIWISAAFPILLSIATSTGWMTPVLTLGLYCILEVSTNNVVEPIVLGGSTGMSPLAVITAALFWTWLWGGIGLVLATPLTACLVVLGRYFPAFHFCSILLASEPPTAMEVKLVRLLTENRIAEAKTLLHEITGARLTLETAEEVLMPMIRTIENELFPGSASKQVKARIYQQMRELIDELAPPLPSGPAEANLEQAASEPPALVIMPFITEGDEIVGQVIEVLLRGEGVNAHVLSGKMLRAEKQERFKELQATTVLLSSIDVKSAPAVDNMVRFLRTTLPEATILVGLWSLPHKGAARLIRRLRESLAVGVYTNLQQALRGILPLVLPAPPEGGAEGGVRPEVAGPAQLLL